MLRIELASCGDFPIGWFASKRDISGRFERDRYVRIVKAFLMKRSVVVIEAYDAEEVQVGASSSGDVSGVSVKFGFPIRVRISRAIPSRVLVAFK